MIRQTYEPTSSFHQSINPHTPKVGFIPHQFDTLQTPLSGGGILKPYKLQKGPKGKNKLIFSNGKYYDAVTGDLVKEPVKYVPEALEPGFGGMSLDNRYMQQDPKAGVGDVANAVPGSAVTASPKTPPNSPMSPDDDLRMPMVPILRAPPARPPHREERPNEIYQNLVGVLNEYRENALYGNNRRPRFAWEN